MLAPSPRFVKGLQANLHYWQQRTHQLREDAAIGHVHVDFPNLVRVVEMGLVLPQTRLATAELVSQCFYWVEKTSHITPWQPLLEQTIAQLPPSELALRLVLLRQLGQFQRRQYQLSAAIATFQQALALLPAGGDGTITADLHLSLAQTYRMAHQYPLAHEHAQEAFAHVAHYSATHIRLIELLGMLAHTAGEYEQACHYYEQAIALQQQTKQTAYLHSTLQEWAITLQTQQKWSAAQAVYDQLIAHLATTANKVDYAHALNGKGSLLYGRGELDQARDCFEQASAVIEPLPHQFYLKGALANNMACVYRDRQQWELAEHLYQRSLAAYQQVGDGLLTAKTEGNLGKLFLRQNRLEEAQKHLQKALGWLASLTENAQAGALREEYSGLLADI